MSGNRYTICGIRSRISRTVISFPRTTTNIPRELSKSSLCQRISIRPRYQVYTLGDVSVNIPPAFPLRVFSFSRTPSSLFQFYLRLSTKQEMQNKSATVGWMLKLKDYIIRSEINFRSMVKKTIWCCSLRAFIRMELRAWIFVGFFL